jgi:hypothetical protein
VSSLHPRLSIPLAVLALGGGVKDLSIEASSSLQAGRKLRAFGRVTHRIEHSGIF